MGSDNPGEEAHQMDKYTIAYNNMVLLPQGMSELLSSQSKVKYLTAAKEGKYKLLIKTPEAVDMERKRQISKLQSLQDITERLRQDFPACDGPLRNILLSIKSKLASCAVPQESKEVTVA